MVLCVMCTREDLGGLAQQQILLLLPRCWNSLHNSPQKSTKQCARETGVSRTSIRRILKTARWKVVIPRLLHALNEDDPDRRVQYCEWFQNMKRENEEFVGKMVWSDQAQFKLNGTGNQHNCVYWAPENPHIHIEKEVNLPGLNVWCGLSYTFWE